MVNIFAVPKIMPKSKLLAFLYWKNFSLASVFESNHCHKESGRNNKDGVKEPSPSFSFARDLYL